MTDEKPSKDAIRAMRLEDFNINLLTIWVERHQKEFDTESEALRYRYRGLGRVVKLNALRQRFKPLIESQPRTVAELMTAYPFCFTISRIGWSMPEEPIAELKRRLISMGFTIEDWPALASNGELIEHLPKSVIPLIPLCEIMPAHGDRTENVRRFFECTDEAARSKKAIDLVLFDVDELMNDRNGRSRARKFFLSRRKLFSRVHQQLVKKGFTAEDGAFMKWKPFSKPLKKVRMMLVSKYGLTPPEATQIAKIAVAEHWV